LPFGIFAGIALIGFALSFGIRGEGLEAEGWSDEDEEESEEEEEQEEEEEEEEEEGINERTGLIRK
jgi:hypothetical protein